MLLAPQPEVLDELDGVLPFLVGMLPEEGGHLGQVHRVLGEAQGQQGGGCW